MSRWELTAIPVGAIAIMFLAPPARLYLAEGVFVFVSGLYQAWITRTRSSYFLAAVGLALLGLVLFLPPLKP